MGPMLYWPDPERAYSSFQDLDEAPPTVEIAADSMVYQVQHADALDGKIVYALECPDSFKIPKGSPATDPIKFTKSGSTGVRIWWRSASEPGPPPEAYEGLTPEQWEQRFPKLTVKEKEFAMRETTSERKTVRTWNDEIWPHCTEAPGLHPAVFRVDCENNVIANPDYVTHGCTYFQIDVDHIFPWSRGGLTHPKNLQPMQSSCNRSKGDGESGSGYASLNANKLDELNSLLDGLSEEQGKQLESLIGFPYSYLRPDEAMTVKLNKFSEKVAKKAEQSDAIIAKYNMQKIIESGPAYPLAIRACEEAGSSRGDSKVAHEIVGFFLQKMDALGDPAAEGLHKNSKDWCADFLIYWKGDRKEEGRRPVGDSRAKEVAAAVQKAWDGRSKWNKSLVDTFHACKDAHAL